MSSSESYHSTNTRARPFRGPKDEEQPTLKDPDFTVLADNVSFLGFAVALEGMFFSRTFSFILKEHDS